MSSVRHSVYVERQCARCMVIGSNIVTGQIAAKRSVRDTTIMTNRFLEAPRSDSGDAEDGNEEALEKGRSVVKRC